MNLHSARCLCRRAALRRLLLSAMIFSGCLAGLEGVARADCGPRTGGCRTTPGTLRPHHLLQTRPWWWLDTGPWVSPAERIDGKEYYDRICTDADPSCTKGPNWCGRAGESLMIYSRPLGSSDQVPYRYPRPGCVVYGGPPPVTAADVRKVVQSRQPQIQLVVNGLPLQVEPRTRRALGRKPVIFYLGQSPVVQPFTVTIRTYRVRVEPYAWRYVWNFDGCAATTTIDVGRGYPDQDEAHMCLYNSFGTVHPYVTVQWRARFSVNNGRAQEAYAGNASLPIDGPRQNLTLVHQHSVLVDGG